MNAKSLLRLSIVLGSALPMLLGCAGAPSVQASRSAKATKPSSLEHELRRQQALKHFIDGAVFDSKGDYARAILEYQEALMYERNPAIYYAIARDYAALGKQALAAEAAREAVRLDSTNITYRENLASIYLGALQTDLAIRQYEEIVRIDSTSSRGWYQLARLSEANRPLRALEIYERLLQIEGDTWELLLQAAEVYQTLGRHAEAAEKYRRMLALDPGNRPLQRQLAEMYGRAGRFDEAVKILQTLLELDEEDAEVLATLADIHLDRGEFKQAAELYERLLETRGESPEVKLRVGIAYYGMIRQDSTMLPKAKAIFEEAGKALPNDWRPFLHLGGIALMEKKDSTASEYFEKVTRLASWNADAWSYLGSIYYEQGNYQRVLETMERAKKAVPKEYRVHLLTGLAYSQLGQKQLAAAALEEAFKLNPNDMIVIGNLALTYDGLQQYEKSDSIYEHALQLNPNAHVILNNYGYSLAERGIQLERALHMAKQAVSMEPRNASYLDTLGWVFYKLRRLPEAEQYIREAVETGEASSTVHEHMGDVYFELGQKHRAIEFWQKALEMNSDNEALKEKIQKASR